MIKKNTIKYIIALLVAVSANNSMASRLRGLTDAEQRGYEVVDTQYRSKGWTEKNTMNYSFKSGAGKIGYTLETNGDCTVTPDGGLAWLHKLKVPHVDDVYNMGKWLKVEKNHYVGAINAIKLHDTSDIFQETLGVALTSMQGINPDGTLTDPQGELKTLLGMLKGSGLPPSATRLVVHYFAPENFDGNNGAVVMLPGSKGVRETEIKQAQELVKNGVSCLILNPIGTAGIRSTIEDQLKKVSFYSNAISLQIALNLLSQSPYVNSNNLVLYGKSIGASQTVISLSPEVEHVMGDLYIKPRHVHLEDLAPVIKSVEMDKAAFWTTDILITGGVNDDYTREFKLDNFLAMYAPKGSPLQNIGKDFHSGHHDATAITVDTPTYALGPYEIDLAKLYGLFTVQMTLSIPELVQMLSAIIAPGTTNEQMGQKFGEFCEKIMGGTKDNYTGKLKLEIIDIPVFPKTDNPSAALKKIDIDVKTGDKLGPIAVSDTMNKLPKGATLGAEYGKIIQLRNKVITDLIKYTQ